MRTVCGEVLPYRQLEPGQRAETESDGDHDEALRGCHEEPCDQHHDADENDDLGERERAPGGSRAVAGAPTQGADGRIRAARGERYLVTAFG
jgi:hypothetical protein